MSGVSSRGDLAPGARSGVAGGTVLNGGEAAAAELETAVDAGAGGQGLPGMARWPGPLRPPLPPSCRGGRRYPERFARSSSVGAYVGLAPRRFQSGEEDRAGRISRCGEALLRPCLFEAAGITLHRVAKRSAPKAWGTRLAKRIGAKKATVAAARKLSAILRRMWKDGSGFRWSAKETQAA